MQAVAACLSRHVGPAATVVVGFSGGLDSTVLLHAASHLAPEAGFRISARHVHHGLSPNADTWADSCKRFCTDLGIPLATVRVDVPAHSGEGLEAAARRVRHEALAADPANWVLLGHHADDQAETILHNLLRGAGLRGAAAMPEANGRLLRPLLSLPRSALFAYANSSGLAWVEDESNADQRYTRNFLRGRAIPMLAERFPQAGVQLAAAACRFGEAESLLDDLARLDLGASPPQFPLPRRVFRELPDARARNLLRALLGWHKVQPPDERRLREFVRQLRSAGNDRYPRIDLADYSLWCGADGLNFDRRV